MTYIGQAQLATEVEGLDYDIGDRVVFKSELGSIYGLGYTVKSFNGTRVVLRKPNGGVWMPQAAWFAKDDRIDDTVKETEPKAESPAITISIDRLVAEQLIYGPRHVSIGAEVDIFNMVRDALEDAS